MNRLLTTVSAICFGIALILAVDGFFEAEPIEELVAAREVATLIAEPHKLEFGAIPLHARLELAVKLRNIGKSQIQLLTATPTCGCTTVDFVPGRLAPGETYLLKLCCS